MNRPAPTFWQRMHPKAAFFWKHQTCIVRNVSVKTARMLGGTRICNRWRLRMSERTGQSASGVSGLRRAPWGRTSPTSPHAPSSTP